MTRWGKLRAAAAGGLLLLAACGAGAGPPTLTARSAACTANLTDPATSATELVRARPGAVLCVARGAFADEVVKLSASGRPERPITVSGAGAVVRALVVTGDHVVVEGFVVESGAGIDAHGAGLTLRDNVVRASTQDGISCAGCTDATIEGNDVSGAVGSGIEVSGARITVLNNAISGSVSDGVSDADGVRFFGNDLRIVGNTITDIKDDGYPGEPPHTDCFQTFDNGKPPTTDVVISGNTCRNVDHQCLIATAEQAGGSGLVGRSRGITFVDNICEVGGSQAVTVRWFPQVIIQGNRLTGPGLIRAAIFLEGSVDALFVNNTVQRGVPPYEVDPASEPGFRTDVRR